ncbi:glycosyl hydrolase [Camillea tinctor]|nr:glycosyl hydrolase [Camillea tinctor]
MKHSLVAACLSTAVNAACSANAVIDDFSQWSSNTNSLGSWTSDDGSMTSISSSGNLLSFIPNANSYLYETFECNQALGNGYNAISFGIKGPAKATLDLEIQTKTSCSSSGDTSKYVTIDGLTGSKQTITIPFSSFPGANADGITAFVWSGFSSTGSEWQLGDIQLVCEGGGSQTTSAPTATTKRAEPSTTGECSNLLVDDWESQSRLTFLYYNAMIEPTSDDGTMQSIIVSNDNRVTLTPSGTDSYFYSKTTCVNAKDLYGGISMRINAPRGTSFEIQLSSPTNCGDEEDTSVATQSTSDLGWSFDGTEKLYSIPLSKFSGLDLTKVTTIFFSGFNNAVIFGPMSFYCGSTPSEYIVPATTAPAGPTSTVPAPSGTASALVIDDFASADANTLGFWHGEDEGMSLTWGNKKLTIKSSDPDYAFYTQVSGTCRDMTSYEGSYLHIVYSGSNRFSVALQQHNSACDEGIMPFPETWDSLEASRYASASDIYMPISHFNIERTRVLGLAIKGFYTTDSVVLSKIEIVPSVPAGFTIPNKLPSGNLVFACKRPNSFAFAIDDGDPSFAQQVLQVVKEEGIKVTFFTVGAPLEDASTNLTNVYNEMLASGHQIALHSFTHPKMEGLPDYEAIDWEYNNDIQAVSQSFNGLHTPYFRPPFGTEGARMRQRLAMALGTDSPYVVMWSVDVEDWLWATGPTPEKQLDAFRRDVNKGGNLVVMHYLYSSTVGYLREFIQIAKATGKQLMRVDQCMEDPNAPPL